MISTQFHHEVIHLINFDHRLPFGKLILKKDGVITTFSLAFLLQQVMHKTSYDKSIILEYNTMGLMKYKMIGGTPEVRSDISLTLLTYDI